LFGFIVGGFFGVSASTRQLYFLFLPILMNRYPIIEIDSPNCRYSKIYGSDQYSIFYKWDSDTLGSPGNPWRIAAAQGIADWDNANTKFNLIEHPWGGTIKLINTSALVRGVTFWWCGAGGASGFEVSYNLYHDSGDQYTNNMRRAIASHEIGHAHFIGHIPNDQGWEGLMLKYASLTYYDSHFSPTNTDITLVNQIYP